MINSLNKIYDSLKKYDEINNYKLLMYDKKIILIFTDMYKIECNKNQIIVYKNNKIMIKENKDFNEMYMYLLNLIKTGTFYIPQSSKKRDTLNSMITILFTIMLINASKMELKQGIIFCGLYILVIILLILLIKGYYHLKLKNIDKKDVKFIKKYIKKPLSKYIYKCKLELEFYNIKEICKLFLKHPNKINMNLKFKIDENYINKNIELLSKSEFNELIKDYKLYLKAQNIIYKYYDEDGTKKDI